MKRLKSFPIRPEDSLRIKIYIARKEISAQTFYTTVINRFLELSDKEQLQLLRHDKNLHEETLTNVRQTFVIGDDVNRALNMQAALHKVSVGKMIRSVITLAVENECNR